VRYKLVAEVMGEFHSLLVPPKTLFMDEHMLMALPNSLQASINPDAGSKTNTVQITTIAGYHDTLIIQIRPMSALIAII